MAGIKPCCNPHSSDVIMHTGRSIDKPLHPQPPHVQAQVAAMAIIQDLLLAVVVLAGVGAC